MEERTVKLPSYRKGIYSGIQLVIGLVFLARQTNYYLIKRNRPVLSKKDGKVTAYQFADPFLRFWFRFIRPNQSLIERQQLSLLRKHVENQYNDFTGLTLEQYFQTKMMESGNFTVVGNWWNRKGADELDLVALNEFEKTGVIAEVKRKTQKNHMTKLEDKVSRLPGRVFGEYSIKLDSFSLEDM